MPRLLRATIVGLLDLIFAVVLLATSAPTSNSLALAATQPAALIPSTVIQLGPMEVLRGPDNFTDNPFNTVSGSSGLLAYLANGYTIGYSGGSLETLTPLPNPVLTAGTGFDSCGAWLNSAWQDGPILRAWYHAETDCHYPQTHKSVGYAESSDGGRTFVKPNYPANQVITAPPRYTNPNRNGEGDQRVLRVGDYLYMYFVANRDYQVRVARSSVTDGGKPGTWYKYYRGSFKQPGLGGESSPIDPTGVLARSWVSFSSYFNSYIGFSWNGRAYSSRSDKFAGYGFTLSSNGLKGWKALPYVVLPSEGEYWGRNQNSSELAEYLSLVSPYGDDARMGDNFWLYYMYLNPGEDFDRRYLVRRQVHLIQSKSKAPVELVPRIAVSEYQKGNDTWFTTTTTDSTYQFEGIIGYLFTDRVAHTIPVYDCYIPAASHHMLDIDPQCNGANRLRRMGWISTVPFSNSVRIYRCFDPAANNHFISTDPACDGKISEWPVGYLAVQPPFPTPQFVALSEYYSTSLQDHWETTAGASSTYAFETRLGYLFTQAAPDSIPVYDCYIAEWQDHMIDTDVNCGNPTVQNWARLGWISTISLKNSVAIYRCYDAASTDHFASLDANCAGKTTEWRIGYLVTAPTTTAPAQ